VKVKLIDITGKPITGEWGKDDEQGIGIPVLRTTNFTNNGIINYNDIVTRIINKKDLSTKYLQNGDIIIEKSGGSEKQPVGRVVYFDAEENTYLFNNFTGVLRITNKKEWHSKYLFYALFWNYIKGGTRKYQNKTTGLHNLQIEQFINQFEIYNKMMEEQQKIAAVLDKVSDLIALRKKQLEKLEELVKACFVEMFGDPVYTNNKYKKVPLGSVAEVGSSKRIFEKEYVSEGVPFYRTKEIVELSKGNKISTQLFITQKRFDELRHTYGVPKKNDLLISAVGTIGVIWIVDGKNDFYFKDGNLLKVSPSNIFNSIYLKMVLESLINSYKLEMSTGTAYAALTISALKQMNIYIVPYNEQEKFANFVTKVDKQKLTIQKSLDKLEVLKKALMQEYFV